MIDLERRDGAVLRIAHRGAAALAPENTLRAFRTAVAQGVDLIEFDVLDLPRGPLVLAHSDRLDEVSHGAAAGSVRERSLAELREVAPELPTLDEALAFFVDEAPELGLHVDLKLTTRLDELTSALRRHGLERRTVVSSFHVPSLRAVARDAPIGADRLHVPGGSLRRLAPTRTGAGAPRGARRAPGGGTRRSAPDDPPRGRDRAHAPARSRDTARGRAARGLLELPVLAWTVDDPADLRRVVEAGVAGVITNDPGIFAAIRT